MIILSIIPLVNRLVLPYVEIVAHVQYSLSLSIAYEYELKPSYSYKVKTAFPCVIFTHPTRPVKAD